MVHRGPASNGFRAVIFFTAFTPNSISYGKLTNYHFFVSFETRLTYFQDPGVQYRAIEALDMVAKAAMINEDLDEDKLDVNKFNLFLNKYFQECNDSTALFISQLSPSELKKLEPITNKAIKHFLTNK